MRARDAAAEAARALAAAGVEEPRFEAEYLARTVAGVSRAAYFAGAELPAERVAGFRELVLRRTRREPAAYLVGHREFRGLDFVVGPGVLVPRPETELLVDLALAEAPPDGGRFDVVDVGTGSGCVATSVALEAQGARVIATEVSDIAIEVARRNALALGADVAFVRGDLATAVARADVVLANLPYIPSGEVAALQPEVSGWEPTVALDGGTDGLDLIRRLVDDCATRLRPRLLALEVGYGQAQVVAEYVTQSGASALLVRDFADIDRVVCARWR
jgi:release factor glutamine methyltransferase